MAASTTTRKFFLDWQFTPGGSFRHKTTGRVLSRKDWEIEMAYEYHDNPDALSEARALAQRAENMKPKV